MRKIDQKQRHGGNNGFIPTSFRSISSYLRIVSSGASTVASTVRSAASAASTIVDRDADPVSDQVLWAGFDNLETDENISRRVLLLGFQYGFQVWDVEDANNVHNIVSQYDGPVSFMQILPKPIISNRSSVEYANDRPLLVISADGSFSAGGIMKNSHDQLNGGSLPTVVWFYSLKSQSYVKELKFRSVVYSVRCSSRVVAVLQAAQVHCFDVATLQRDYTILTNPIITSSSRFENIGVGPLAVGPRWIAYSGSIVALPNTRVPAQHLIVAPGSNGSVVAHYAKQSSKQIAVGIVTLGDFGYKKLSRYYSELLPDGNVSREVNDYGRKDRGNPNGRLLDTENVGMVIVRDVVSKSVISQFKAHDSPIASLCFDPSGTLLVTASVHGHNFNVFRIFPRPENCTSYIHLYKLQRGFTNAVIQDISFSIDSRYITISSSRCTSHLFALQSTEEHLTTNNPPITLSAITRIRNGNNGGVIASIFHKYRMLVFSSFSGCLIQYALRLSSNIDDDSDSRLIVEPIQKWNVCNKQNRREREENVDVYGENGCMDNRKVFPEKTENENKKNVEFMIKVEKDNVGVEERCHVYISEVELRVHQTQVPLWARAQIYFQSLTIDEVTMDKENNLKGEFEIEKIPTHTVEARSRYLIPAVDHFRGINVQMTRNGFDPMKNTVVTHGGFENGDEDTDGFVNNDISPISQTRPETVYNRERSESGTRSELVNNNIDQKVENRFEDQG